MGLSWGVILSAKTIFIVDQFSLYNFYGYPIIYPINIQGLIIQFWSNTPVYIALVSALELIIDV